MSPSSLLEASFREAGLAAYGLVGRASLREACASLPPALRERLGVEAACGAVAVALAYSEGTEGPPPAAAPRPWAAYPGPLARLGRFARANWYAELGARLKDAASRLRGRLGAEGGDPGPARDWRYFVNSSLPEKRLALEAGLGRLGRNGLVLLPALGSAAVLGLLLLPSQAAGLLGGASLPEPSAAEGARRLAPACERCGSCVDACPTGALRPGGEFATELCLQHWASLPGELPPPVEAAWGDRLYGCDACQEACPLFKPEASARTDRGLLGPGLPIPWLIAAGEGEIRSALRGSALGMGWISIEALKRNAGLAARRVGI